MITPRNTAVIVRLLLQNERIAGNIVVPTNKELYGEAEVMAVGPGNVSAAGGRSETHDLKVGQRVFARIREVVRDPSAVGGQRAVIAGIEYREGDQTYHIFEQMSVLGIIAEAGEYPRPVAPAPALTSN